MSILFSTNLSPIQQFYVMVYVVTIVGGVSSLTYFFGVPEVPLSKKSDYHDQAYQAKKKELEGD